MASPASQDDSLRDGLQQLPRVVSDIVPPQALLSNHHRIKALSQAWGEQRNRDRRLGTANPDGSSSETDSDPDAAQAPARASATPKRAGNVTETPVPLPEFPRPSAPKLANPPPPAAASAATPSEPAKDAAALRASALGFTEASALKFLEEARASVSGRMHFATGGELLARTLQDAQGAARHHGNALPATPIDLVTTDDEDIAMPRRPPNTSSGCKQEMVLLGTQDQRRYNVLPHADGRLEGGRGCLFPTNYELLPDDPRYICPVRDCRRLFDVLMSLGGHFSAKHCETKLNDNLDGTFSVVDRYKNHDKHSPAIVVSRQPLPSNAPPPAEPMASYSLKKRLENGTPAPAASSGASTPQQDSLAATATARPDLPARSVSDGCSYLDTVLGRKQKVPLRGDVDYLKELPRLRDLPQSFIRHHHDRLLGRGQYVCALGYLVGDEVTGPNACTQKYATSRLSDKCIALPAGMPEALKRLFFKVSTCMGCFYRSDLQRQRNNCDWAANGVDENSWEGSDADAEGPAPTMTQAKAEPAALPPTLPRSTRERPKRSAQGDAGDGPAHKVARVREGSSAWGQEVGSLQMEVWEAAPGRQTNSSGENMGFSGRYMMGTQPIQVFQDVFMNTIPIAPGASNRWPADSDKARLFTVLSGKVTVTIDDDSLTLGLHGVWKVMPGQTCQAQNRYYFPAEIQCVTIES